MKSLWIAPLLTGLLAACGSQQASTSDVAAAESHVDANHCEIFVDKVSAAIGSHGSLTITTYVKLLKDKFLDGPVVEVGYRGRMTTHSYSSGDSQGPWQNQVLQSFSPVGDYWALSYGQMVHSDFGSTQFEGVYYAKTASGRYYWAKPQGGGNFTVDSNFGRTVYEMYGLSGNYSTTPDRAKSTQDNADLRYLNPKGCR